jgi:hypothetical protein
LHNPANIYSLQNIITCFGANPVNKGIMKIQPAIFILLILVSFSGSAYGAGLIISSTGNGVFTLQGVGLADVAGIDATIRYDTTGRPVGRSDAGN